MKAHDNSFSGFTPKTFKFLAGLARNNNKKWFDAHRNEYDSEVVQPALLFVDAMGGALAKVAPGVVGEPRVGGSLFRIYKDTRFSKDKKPYKTHVGIRLREPNSAISSACAMPLFYVELDAKNLKLGVGIKTFDKQTLQAYRRGVAQGDLVTPVSRIIRSAQGKGHTLGGEILKRIPLAYTGQTDDELIKRKGLFVMHEQAIPQAIYNPGFVAYCLRWFKSYAHLYKLLNQLRGQVTG